MYGHYVYLLACLSSIPAAEVSERSVAVARSFGDGSSAHHNGVGHLRRVQGFEELCIVFRGLQTDLQRVSLGLLLLCSHSLVSYKYEVHYTCTECINMHNYLQTDELQLYVHNNNYTVQ